MNQYNPCLEIEFVKLDVDGAEEPMDVDLFGGMADLIHHSGNRPLRVECSINKSLGSVQQSASITIHNSPFIEELKSDYNTVMDSIRKQIWRVRIWAWHSDSVVSAPKPADISPVFVGDIIDDMSVSSGGVNDSSIQINAQGHGWLTTALASGTVAQPVSGHLQKTWLAGTSCREIVEFIFQDYFIDVKGYGGNQGPSYVIREVDNKLTNDVIDSSMTVDRNPIAVMDDICRQHDYIWGFNNLKPYILPKDRGFDLLDLPVEFPGQTLGIIKGSSGLLSLVDMGKYEFNFKHYWDKGFVIGTHFQVEERPQLDIPMAKGPAGRINSLSVSLDNYGEHSCSVNCQGMIPKPVQLSGGIRYALPPNRYDTSGRSVA